MVSQKLTDTDRAEIVRELINLSFGIPDRTKNTNTDTIIMSDDNIKLDWVPIEQKFRINVTTRSKIQDRTEKTGELYYFTVSKMTQRGGCVGISMLNGLTAKGQSDDANMAGGGASYEFHKVDGHWIGIRLSAWIS